jgi:phage baseplate assembly protein W
MNQSETPSVFGRSLQLAGGDLRIVAGDFAMVSGRDNFLQALQVMIETPFGTDIFNINYGFDLLASVNQPQSVRLIKELIRLHVVKSLSLDDRVREIREVVFDDEPRFFEIDPRQNEEASRRERKAARRWQALALLETITEGEVAVQLEGAGV